jgi:hypothetical protein
MERIPCSHCGDLFKPSPRHKNQIFCMKPECRRARKTAWQSHKMKTDPEYRLNQKASQRQWTENHPGYWREYRRKNPQKAERNRILQSLRNRRTRKATNPDGTDSVLIAKMDSLGCSLNTCFNQAPKPLKGGKGP